jgi:ABC-type histidine transport system ATPase subunit
VCAEPILEVHDLHKSFRRLKVSKGVSLSIPPGEVMAIIGPSGSGKSTLLRCINSLEMPISGEIFFQGERIDYKSISLNYALHGWNENGLPSKKVLHQLGLGD